MRIYLPDASEAHRADDWEKAQTDAGKWKPGFSAHALAHTWQPAPTFPPAALTALCSRPPLFDDITPKEAYIERATKMPGKGYASFTDLLIVAESAGEKVVIGVEGKREDDFAAFVRLYSVSPVREEIIPLTVLACGIQLHTVWVSDTAPL